MFLALSDQLYENDSKHAELREEITDFILENRHQYCNFIHEEFDVYISEMKMLGTYGTNVEIQGFKIFYILKLFTNFRSKAFSELKNAEVVIYSDQNPHSPPVVITPFEKTEQAPLQVRLSYHRGNHYNSVRSIGDESKPNDPGVVMDIKSEPEKTFECPYGCGKVFKEVDLVQVHMVAECPIAMDI